MPQSHSFCPVDGILKSPSVTKLGSYPQTKREYLNMKKKLEEIQENILKGFFLSKRISSLQNWHYQVTTLLLS